MIFMYRDIFQALNSSTFFAIEVCVGAFMCYTIIQRIFNQLIVDNNFMDNVMLFKCFERPIESSTVVVAGQSFPDFIFRERLICVHNNINNSLTATCPFKIMTV